MNINSNEILVNEILNICFPIGKIEMFLDNEDHSNYMGFTWVRCLSERSPIGYNPGSSDDNYKTIGSQFGEKTHKLSIAELPKHDHHITAKGINTGASSTAQMGSYPIYIYADRVPNWPVYSNEWYTDKTGSDTAHNNIHPVEVVAFWRRIS